MDVAGKILTPLGMALNHVAIKISYPDMGDYMTNEAGVFEFKNLPATTNYTVYPEKNDNPLNGVSTFDLLIIRKHILNTENLDTPYKMIAADINRSGTVTTFDLVELRKLILGIYDAFPQNTSWRFVAKNFEFEDNLNPFIAPFPEALTAQSTTEDMVDADFIAVKIGDLDYSASTNAFSEATPRNSKESIVLTIPDQTFKAGDQVNLAIKTKEQQAILGYQFALNFDESVLSYIGFQKAGIQQLADFNFGTTKVNKGILTTSWDTEEALNIEAKQPLFHLQFIAKKAGTLQEVLAVDNSRLKPELYTETVEIHPLIVDVEASMSAKPIVLYQNQPNPFSENTIIGFEMAKSEEASLSIYDVNGRRIYEIKEHFTEGYHEVEINNSVVKTGGLLYYTLETKDQRIGKRMLLIKDK